MKKSITILFIVHASLFTLHPSVAQIIHVPADQPTIQEGIDAASTGDTVLVADGTYIENINFLGKAITVASHFIMDADTNHIANTIIDGSQADDPDAGSVVTFANGEDTTSLLCGFTITGGTGTLFVTDNVKAGGGIICYNAGAKICRNHIEGNRVSHPANARGGGIASGGDGGEYWIVIRDNTISNDTVEAYDQAAYGGGMHIETSAIVTGNLVEYNQVIGNADLAGGAGMSCLSSMAQNYVFVLANTIENNDATGTWVWGGGLYVYLTGAKIYGNDLSHNTLSGTRVWGGGLYVGQAAGDLKVSGNLVEYNEISGTEFCVGGGMNITYPTAEVSLVRNTVSNNNSTGSSYGGGAYFNTEEAEINIDGNIFENNTFSGVGAGGAVYTQGYYNFNYTNNLFIGNNATAAGGAIYVSSPAAKLNGALCYDLDERFTDDVRGDNVIEAPDYVFINNTFKGNTADYNGGAIRCNFPEDALALMNNIFLENIGADGDDIHYSGAGIMLIDHNCMDTSASSIYGAWTGMDNFSENPEFLDDSCHIDEFSPCYNAGIDSLEYEGAWYVCPEEDYEGFFRPWGSAPDIGADECDFGYKVPNPYAENERQTLAFTRVIPNPASSSTRIGFNMTEFQDVVIELFDPAGKRIKTLLSARLGPGDHQVFISTETLNSGVYLVRLTAGNYTDTRKVVVQK